MIGTSARNDSSTTPAAIPDGLLGRCAARRRGIRRRGNRRCTQDGGGWPYLPHIASTATPSIPWPAQIAIRPELVETSAGAMAGTRQSQSYAETQTRHRPQGQSGCRNEGERTTPRPKLAASNGPTVRLHPQGVQRSDRKVFHGGPIDLRNCVIESLAVNMPPAVYFCAPPRLSIVPGVDSRSRSSLIALRQRQR